MNPIRVFESIEAIVEILDAELIDSIVTNHVLWAWSCALGSARSGWSGEFQVS